MKQCFSLLSALIFLMTLPGSGLSQQDTGIPPMLENKRPLSISETKPPTPPPDLTKAKNGAKTKTAKGKKVKKQTGTQASKNKKSKAAKKKGNTAKPRGKSTADRT